MDLLTILRRRLLRPTCFIGLVIFLWIATFSIILLRKVSHRRSVLGHLPPFTNHDTSYLLSQKTDSPIKDAEIFEDPEIAQDDPKLLAFIRQHNVVPPPPPPKDKAANKERLDAFGIRSQFRKQLRQLFGDKTGGFFIEAGANDGIFLSNTLELERDYGWTGLLIEPNYYAYFGLKRLKRNAWISNACLALSPVPQKAEITQFVGRKFNGDYRGAGFIESEFARDKYKPGAEQGVISGGKSNCYPLYSILLAIGMPNVDYFSLDVQGIEMKILRTIPFDKVKIRVISVEHNIVPEGKEAMRDFLESKGYDLFFEDESDYIFVLRERET